jgi:hypothetical protein
VLQSQPVSVYSADFQRCPLTIQMGDYDDAYEAFAQHRHVESACFPSELHCLNAVLTQFSKATLQFSFACFWIAKDRGIGFCRKILGEHGYEPFQSYGPSLRQQIRPKAVL